MPGFPVPLIKFREDNQNGFPLAGGKLHSYVAGTNTRKPTYNNQDLAVGHENPNPTILDASGRADIWVQDGSAYKFILEDALGNQIWTQDNVSVPAIVAPVATVIVPPGVITAFGGSVAPAGAGPVAEWLLCDGSAVSRSTFSALFGVINVLYGAGNLSTTFNVPNLRGRFPLGLSLSGTVGVTLGAIGGALDHVHAGPSHQHTILGHTHGMSHTHTIFRDGWGAVLSSPNVTGRLQTGQLGAAGPDAQQYLATNDTTSGGSPLLTDPTSLTTQAAGTADTGGANPAFLTINYIIKT